MANRFHICLLLCAIGGFCSVLSDNLQLEPLKVTVLQGSDARFNATVQRSWTYMTFHVQNRLALTVPATGEILSSKNYSAKFCAVDKSCVEFTIHNTNHNQSGPVVCFLQGAPVSRTAHLDVQVSGEINIKEGNVTVEQGQQVEFECVMTGWYPKPIVSWIRNNQTVNSSLYNTTHEDGHATSVLKFQAVSNTTVECQAIVPALHHPKSSFVYLVVVPKPPDWTVLIAVVCSIGGFALLVLLIIGIIFCCKRRKEKQANYQDEMSRRVRTQSQLSGVNPTGQQQGQVNAGYVKDNQVTRTSIAPSELYLPSILEMPDIVNSNQAGNIYNNAYNIPNESSLKKHRHLTIV
ncbi:immunoglobulin superfamily member 5 isoform X1 [Thunnus thynnus]|uniref:immunoglobulin superfamily member 5 isoform X1 n=1 Tax=Thunnus thynnus TaxID=8237 RepID=UPI003528C809